MRGAGPTRCSVRLRAALSRVQDGGRLPEMRPGKAHRIACRFPFVEFSRHQRDRTNVLHQSRVRIRAGISCMDWASCSRRRTAPFGAHRLPRKTLLVNNQRLHGVVRQRGRCAQTSAKNWARASCARCSSTLTTSAVNTRINMPPHQLRKIASERLVLITKQAASYFMAVSVIATATRKTPK